MARLKHLRVHVPLHDGKCRVCGEAYQAMLDDRGLCYLHDEALRRLERDQRAKKKAQAT